MRRSSVLTRESLSEEMLAPEIEGDAKGTLYLLKMSEERAWAFLDQVRWPRGVVCTGCRSKDIRVARPRCRVGGIHECLDCGLRFGVTTGIRMGRAGTTLRTWLMAIYLLCCTDRQLNVFQLARILGVNYYQASRQVRMIAQATGWTRERSHIMFYSLEAAVYKVVKS